MFFIGLWFEFTLKLVFGEFVSANRQNVENCPCDCQRFLHHRDTINVFVVQRTTVGLGNSNV